MTMFWMLEVRSPKVGKRAVIARQPDLRDFSVTGFSDWMSGKPFSINFPQPLVFHLDKSGGELSDFFPTGIPLMSKRMLGALKTVGVDNLEVFPALLLDGAGVAVAEEFVAINILGRVACANLDESECEFDDPDSPVGVDFDSLVIDEDRAGDHLFFRLHEAVNGIVVHDKVRAALAPLLLRGIVFVDPADWIG